MTWHHLDPHTGPVEPPPGWHKVEVRSTGMLRLMGLPREPHCESWQVLGYTTKWPRDKAELCIASIVCQHVMQDRGVYYYLGRNILCADLWFQHASDAVLFKLSL